MVNARTSYYIIISEKYEKYAEKVLNLLENHEIRALVDNRNETIGKKIREAEMNKYPYMIIIGEKKRRRNNFCPTTWRRRYRKITIEAFAEIIKEEISKTLKRFNKIISLTKNISHSNRRKRSRDPEGILRKIQHKINV